MGKRDERRDEESQDPVGSSDDPEMTSVRIWPRCRFGVRFRVWGVFWAGSPRPKKVAEGAEKVHKVGERDPSESDVLWGRPSPLWPCGPCGPCGPSRQARQGFTSPHTRILLHTRHGDTHTEHTHTHGLLLLPAPPPAHAGPCKPCRAHACPRLRTKLPGFASPAPNYRCTWMWYPYRYPYGRPLGWCCP